MAKAIVTITVILLVIGIVLFILVGDLAAKIFRVSTRTSDSFNTLIAEIENAEEGSQSPVAFFLDNDKNAIFGFAPNAEKLELVLSSPSKESAIFTKRPDKKFCPMANSCICLCSEVSYASQEFLCPGKLNCRVLDNILITDYTYISELRTGAFTEKYFWRNGFGIVKSSKFPAWLQDILSIYSKGSPKALYVRKDFGRVGVCAQSNCIVTQIELGFPI